MANESIRSSDIAMATGGDDTNLNETSKDEQTNDVQVQQQSESNSNSRVEQDVTYSTLETEADAFTRFIERQRMDMMFELRRLRLGDRPVSGQPNRERIETFLTNMNDNQRETRAPSARAPAPSAHIADIDALANRQYVTTALSSITFRQDLENTIRRTINTRPVVAAVARTPQAPLPTPPIPISTVSTVPRPPPVQQQQLPQVAHVERYEEEINAWENITQIQRDRIVTEISDLVHRQLVTSALESDFRQHLERNILYRLERGAPVTVEQDVQPARVAVEAPPNLREANTTNNSRVSLASIDSITSRLDSMQQMLQLMYSMQMDMQRTLRQEVASALANQTTPPSSLSREPVQSGHCTVCLIATADTVLYRCGHLCVCYTCGLQLRQMRSVEHIKCPVCRAPVEDILRVYRSSPDAE